MKFVLITRFFSYNFHKKLFFFDILFAISINHFCTLNIPVNSSSGLRHDNSNIYIFEYDFSSKNNLDNFLQNPDLCNPFLIVVFKQIQENKTMSCYQDRIVERLEFDLLTPFTRVRIPLRSEKQKKVALCKTPILSFI